MNSGSDVVVVGGGPAGLSAACAAYDCGLRVALVDEQGEPGGQLFRQVSRPPAPALYDAAERRAGLELVERFHAARIAYHARTVVWESGPHGVSCSASGMPTVAGAGDAAATAFALRASSVILAPGGMERPVPFPGWTLPGVMSAGGADILLRSGGSLPVTADGPVVLAGNGPMLLLLACHLLHAGIPVVAWLDTGRLADRLGGLLTMPPALLDMPYMLKGLRMAWRIVRGRIPLISGVHDLRAVGDSRLRKVLFRTGATTRELNASVLVRHEGIIPRTHMPAAARVPQVWDDVQRYWRPHADMHGRTAVDGLYVTGDAGQVHGGEASCLKGTLTGIDAARRLGVLGSAEAERRAAPVLRRLRRLLAARAYLRRLFAPHPRIFRIPDDTVVCRCECVCAGHIRQAAAEHFCQMDEIKRATRCGMGACQGRMCGQAAAEIAAQALATPTPRVGVLHIRQPVRPVLLEDFCQVHGAACKQAGEGA